MRVSKTSGGLGLVASGVKARASAKFAITKGDNRRAQSRGLPSEKANTAARKWTAVEDQGKTRSKELSSPVEAEDDLIQDKDDLIRAKNDLLVAEKEVREAMADLQSNNELDEADREEMLSNLKMRLEAIVDEQEEFAALIRETEESLGQAKVAARSIDRPLEDKRS